jgi:hypothetical protein
MRFRDAKKLRDGDEVILKENGQVYKILGDSQVWHTTVLFKLLGKTHSNPYCHLDIK